MRRSFIAKLLFFLGAASIAFLAIQASAACYKRSKGPSYSSSAFFSSLESPPLPRAFFRRHQKDRALLSVVDAALCKRSNEADETAIPRIIHQIWLFSEPPTDDAAYAMETVRRHNPSYRYILWTREMVDGLIRQEFGSSSDLLYRENTPALADYVAAHLLENMGGFVLDPWSEALSSLDPIAAHAGRMVIAIEPPAEKLFLGGRRLVCSPGFVASAPHADIISQWKEEIKRRLGRSLLQPKEYGGDQYKKMHWISVDALTEAVSSSSVAANEILFVGPLWWCPIRPAEAAHFHKRISGLSGHRSTLQKVRELSRCGLPLFSSIDFRTVLFHLPGGRMGMTASAMHPFISAPDREEQ